MMSKRIAKLLGTVNAFVRSHARILTKIFAIIGLICVGLWFIVHFWTVIKVVIGILLLGAVCGGIKVFR